jgi:hypothetical protein
MVLYNKFCSRIILVDIVSSRLTGIHLVQRWNTRVPGLRRTANSFGEARFGDFARLQWRDTTCTTTRTKLTLVTTYYYDKDNN